jgi:hypothetical protein
MRHRTALVIAASVAAVVFAGAIAVAVNLGILTAADSQPVGELTTATVSQQSPILPVAQRQSQAAAVQKKARATQKYVIKKAGTVTVAFSKKAVRFVSAGARRHWSWKLSQTRDRKLTVTFTRGSDTYTFVAAVGRGGKLSARVDHPVTRVVPASGGGGGSTWVSAQPVPSTPPASPAGEPDEGHSGGEEADD